MSGKQAAGGNSCAFVLICGKGKRDNGLVINYKK